MVKTEKEIIADGELATSFRIKMVYSDGREHAISSVKYKYDNTVSYIVYSPKNGEVLSYFNEAIRLIEDNYKIQLFPVYLDENDISVCKFKLGGIELELYCNYETNAISLSNINGDISQKFSDDLVVYLTHNLLQFASRKETRGSGK